MREPNESLRHTKLVVRNLACISEVARPKVKVHKVSLIRFGGHLPRGGYDGQNGIKQGGTTGTTTVHRGVQSRAVRLVLDEERTVGAVARELDLTPSALAGWVRAGQAERTQGKSGLMKEDREELVRLRKELRIVQEEREILKKAAAYFAKQSR